MTHRIAATIVLSSLIASGVFCRPVFADSFNEYNSCVKDICYQNYQEHKIMQIYKNCQNECKKKFPNGYQEALDNLNNLAAGKGGANVNIKSVAKSPSLITFNIPIGTLRSCTISETENNCLGQYLKAWYGFAIGIAGIFATVIIMYGGFKYLTSRGDKGMATKGKDYIIGAATGLSLVFLSYTIVSLVNPNLTVINMPALPSFKDNTGTNLTDSMNENINESDGTSAAAIDPASVVGSSDPEMDKLTGTQALVDAGTKLLTDLQAQGKIPEGLRVTSGYRAGSAGQHGSGNAFDVAWPDMTVEQADAFVASVQSANPAFSTIIEFNGTYGSTGNNVHLDLRPVPVHLRGV